MAVLNQSFKSLVVPADIQGVKQRCAGFFVAAALLLAVQLANVQAATACNVSNG